MFINKQKGPAVAIKNSSLLAVTILSWLILGHEITGIQWICIGILLVGLFVTSAGDEIVKYWREKRLNKTN